MNQYFSSAMQSNNYATGAQSPARERLKSLRMGIWVYFFLLIFEGALRKWFLTPLATPLLVVRDPVGIWLLYRSLQTGALKMNSYILTMLAVGSISFVATIMVGHHDVFVAAYGLRILWIHFPLMFVIAQVFDKEDVIELGKMTIYMAIPMLLLILVQFFNPPGAWINQGVGGTGSAAFSGAMGYYRPSGTFSFTNGNSLFWGLLAPFIFYFWLKPGKLNRYILWAGTAVLFLSIPFSISRGLFFHVIITVIFALFILLRKPKYLSRFIIASAGIVILFILLSNTALVSKGVEVFTVRFTRASKIEGGTVQGTLIDRFLGSLFSPIINSKDVPFFGLGLGMGTNAGAKLLTGERTYFLIAEGEWGRLIGEMGLLLGLTVIVTRLVLVIQMGWNSLKKIKAGAVLPWLLFSFGGITVLTTQWGQPTALGFSTLIGGLVLASLKE